MYKLGSGLASVLPSVLVRVGPGRHPVDMPKSATKTSVDIDRDRPRLENNANKKSGWWVNFWLLSYHVLVAFGIPTCLFYEWKGLHTKLQRKVACNLSRGGKRDWNRTFKSYHGMAIDLYVENKQTGQSFYLTSWMVKVGMLLLYTVGLWIWRSTYDHNIVAGYL